MKNLKRVIFVCVGNAARSQMAEGFARHHGGEKIEVSSAGTKPAGIVSSGAVEAMREKGIDIGAHWSKPISPELVERADMMVTMGCGPNACPAAPPEKLREWNIEDPLGKSSEELREIRDEIETKVLEILDDLSGDSSKT